MVEREAAGDFEYLHAEADDDWWDNQPQPVEDTRFDAFNVNTWNFKPAPKPWYRTGPALIALIAATIATVAIVVAVVLLAFRGPSGGDESTTVPATTPTSAAPSPSPTPTSRPPAPPPPPPPPPAATADAPANRAPTYRTQRPRQTKEPEIGVTRTPQTRSPISVAPQPRRPRS